MAFDAGTVVVGVQIGGVTAFLDGWKGVAAAVGKAVLEMSGELFKLMKDTGAAAEQFQNLAKQTGLSAQMVQRLAFAAEQSGTSLDKIQQGLQKAVREGAIAGGDEGLMKAVNALNAIEDPAQRAAEAFEMFGRSAPDILLVADALDQTSADLERFGLALDATEMKIAGEFDDAIDGAEASVKGLGQTLAVQAMPAVGAFGRLVSDNVPKLTKWIEENNFLGRSLKYVVDMLATLGLMITLVGDGLNNISKQVAQFAMSVVQSLRSMTAGMTSETAMQMFGINPDALRQGADELQEWALSLRREGLSVAESTMQIGAALGKLKSDAEAISAPVREAAGATSALGQAMAEAAAGGAGAAPGSRERGPGASVQPMDELYQDQNRKLEDGTKKTYGGMTNTINAFARNAGAAWQNYMKQGKGVLDSLGRALVESVGGMAMSEGLYHIVAGLAMMFTPGMSAIGKQRMAAGMKLTLIGALFGGIGGGGGSESTATGDTGPAGASYGSDTPGTEVEKEKRPTLNIIVQGDMLDSRQTWNRIAEMSHEFSDHDIKLALGAVEA